MKARSACLVPALALSLAASARGGHAAAARLAKPISVSFLETPVSRAVQEIGRLANVAVVVDERGLSEKARRFPVSLQLKRAPARKVLDLLTKDAGIGYSLDGLVVFVSTRARTRAQDVLRRTYDVRDLTCTVSDFPGPDFMPKERLGAAGGGPIALSEAQAESIIAAGSLAELIMSRIRPSEWGADIGTSIEERSGRLVVMQTKEVHAEIGKLLDELRATEALFIRLEAKGFVVEHAKLEEALRGIRPPGFLRPEDFSRVEKRLLAGGAARIGTARTICMNNQRTHVFSGTISHYVSDVDVSGSVYDPVMTQAFDGFIVDILPVASHDRRFVALEIRIEAPESKGARASRKVIEGRPYVVAQGASWSVSKKGDEVSASGGGSGAAAPLIAPARIQPLQVNARHVVTNVQVPKGVTAYFTVPAGGGRAALFTVRPTLAE